MSKQIHELFLNDFILYNDMDIHLARLKVCFHKCKIFGINLNPNKCAFLVFLGMILRFIVSKWGVVPKLTNSFIKWDVVPNGVGQQIRPMHNHI